MKKFVFSTGLIASSLGLLMPATAQADFTADSKVKMELKNFYLDRKYIGSTSDVYSWSQGADLQYFSGYTDTAVMLGLDASATGAVTLDSQGNDGSLPYYAADDETADNYGRVGATIKAKYSKTELKVGDYRPHLPIAWDDTSRQLDTIYEGAVLESKEVDKLTFTAGRFWKAVTRESSDKEKLYTYKYSGEGRSDGLDFAGASYQFIKGLNGTYFYGKMNDFYQQQYFGLDYMAPLSDSVKLKTDVRYFTNKDDGKAYAGNIDADAIGAMFTLLSGNHMFAVSYQDLSGDTVFPTPNGAIPQPYLLHWSPTAFIMPDERSYGIRYAYNFKDYVPGLKLFARYITADDIDIAGGTDETQSERAVYVSYEVQNPAFKGLKFDLRDILNHQSFSDGYEEIRFITTYTREF